jgi:colanic acid/amylovoran biosynthesis protein
MAWPGAQRPAGSGVSGQATGCPDRPPTGQHRSVVAARPHRGSEMKKILIINTVASNGGDAAILLALRGLAARAFGEDFQLLVYDSMPEVAARYYPEFTFRRQLYDTLVSGRRDHRDGRLWGIARRFRDRIARRRIEIGIAAMRRNDGRTARLLLSTRERDALKPFREADLVVSTGGTYLVENYNLAPRIFEFEVALAFERPLVLFTQSLGPFHDKRNRVRFARIFRGARRILVRDEASFRNCQDLGVPEDHVMVSADAVFALAEQGTLRRAADRRLPEEGDGLQVGISVREWNHFEQSSAEAGMERYIDSVQAVTEHLVRDHGATVNFLSTCQGVAEYRWDDSRIAREVTRRLDPALRENVRVCDGFIHPLRLIEHVAGMDLVIATRMHMGILSLVGGTPVLPIAYEFKTTELFRRLGMEAWVHDIESITPETLVKSLADFLKQLPSIRRGLFARVEDERVRAVESATALARAVTHSPSGG